MDEAGNKAVDTVSIVPGAKLYSPARGSSVVNPPLLAWRLFARATYYNVQLYFGVGNAFRQVASLDVSGRKVLSAWPLQPRYRLKKAWNWNEKKRALARGTIAGTSTQGSVSAARTSTAPDRGQRLLRRQALARDRAVHSVGAVTALRPAGGKGRDGQDEPGD